MTIWDFFSKRMKRQRGEISDVFQYDQLPQPLKVQIVHIIQDVFNIRGYISDDQKKLWSEIRDIFCREYGVFHLTEEYVSPIQDVINYFLQEQDIEKCLDVVEVIFSIVNTEVKSNQYIYNHQYSADKATKELNLRLKEHSIGFQFESGRIIRMDSQFIHSEAIKPTLTVLSDKRYDSAQQEFLRAHEHFRKNRYSESINECLKAFETTLKIICTNRGWALEKTDTAKKLINICFQNELIPSYLQSQFSSLQNLLESGVPTIRNKETGHGQGPERRHISESLSQYVLNLTATNILFLANLNNEK